MKYPEYGMHLPPHNQQLLKLLQHPKGPSAQILGFSVPKTIQIGVFGAYSPRFWYLDPVG